VAELRVVSWPLSCPGLPDSTSRQHTRDMGNWQGKGKKGKAKVGEAELRQHVDNMKIEPRLTSVAATRDKGPKGRKPPTKMQKVMNLLRATKELKKEEKPAAAEVVTVKDLDSVTKAPVLDSLTGGRPAPPKNRRRPTHVKGGGSKSVVMSKEGEEEEEKETVVRKKLETYTGPSPQSLKEAQAEGARQRSSSVGGIKPVLPDKGSKPKKKPGFLRPPSSEPVPTQESAMSPLPSVEEEEERESLQKPNKGVDSGDNDKTADSKEKEAEERIPADSDEIKVETRDQSVHVEEDNENAAAAKEVTCDASELEKPLALAFTAPAAIEFKQLEAIQFEKIQEDENSDKYPTEKKMLEEAPEKWKDAVDIAVKSKSEKKEPSEEGNHVNEEEKRISDLQVEKVEHVEEENNNEILSELVTDKEVNKTSIEESNKKDDGGKCMKEDKTDKEECLALTKEEEPIKAEQEASFERGEAESVIKASGGENENEKTVEEKLVKVSEGSLDLVEKGAEEKKGDLAVGGGKE